jgi:hypothetical protein
MDNNEAKQLGRIEGTLEHLIHTQEAHNESMERKLDTIDERLRYVEKKSAVASVVISSVISVATGLVTAALTLGKK